MIKLFTSSDPFLLQSVKSELDALSIPYLVKNEFAGGAMGELPWQESQPELWLIDESLPYGVIHRLAMAKEYRGLGIAKFIFEELHQKLEKSNIKSLKIDTHEENLGMQSLIKKMGYKYCGCLLYTSPSPRDRG